MATYTAVATLMQGLQQHLSSNGRVFGSSSEQAFRPFTKKEIEILYDSVNLMDSFLRDSSGLSYDHQLMNPSLEEKIRDLARKAGNYLDFWAVQCLPDPELIRRRVITECPNLTELTQEMISINEELDKIFDRTKAQDLEGDSSTAGKSSTFLSPFRRISNITEGKVMCLDKDSINMSPERERYYMATYDLVVSSMKSLEQFLKDYREFSWAWFCPFTAQEISILYHNVSLMASFLCGSSGERSYRKFRCHELSEKRILDVADKAGSFVDFLFNRLEQAVLCLLDTRFTGERIISEDPTMTKITEDIVSINKELKKIRDNRKVQDLEITSSTGKLHRTAQLDLSDSS